MPALNKQQCSNNAFSNKGTTKSHLSKINYD